MQRSRLCGFTLLELLTVVAVVAILAFVAVPSLADLAAAVKVRTAANDVFVSLIFARSEAIKRGSDVSVVPNGSDYATGWIVQAGTTILQNEQALSGVDQAPGPTITYQPDGRLTTTATADVQFKNSAYPDVEMRCVVTELSGTPYVEVDTNGNTSDGCN